LRFLDLLRDSRVTAVADVRSAPVSRFVAHFNKAALAASLAESGIAYILLGKELGRFLGKELGGVWSSRSCSATALPITRGWQSGRHSDTASSG
jgi:uncharacterized protein (DUF488 family)